MSSTEGPGRVHPKIALSEEDARFVEIIQQNQSFLSESDREKVETIIDQVQDITKELHSYYDTRARINQLYTKVSDLGVELQDLEETEDAEDTKQELKASISSFEDLIANMEAEISTIDEYTLKETTQSKLDQYKEKNRFYFDMDDQLNLIKLSRKGNGPEFSVMFVKDESGNTKRFILYKGKSRTSRENDQQDLGAHALGRGGFGSVKIAQDYDTNELVSVKVLKLEMPSKLDPEIEGLKKAKQFKGHIFRTQPEGNKGYLFQPLYYGSNLASLVKDGIDPKECLELIRGCTSELNNFHVRDLIHCDIKLDNYIWDSEQSEAHLIDMAGIKKVEGDSPITVSDYELLYSPGYVAPEVLEQNINSKRSDIYSLGILAKILVGSSMLKQLGEHRLSDEFRAIIKSIIDPPKDSNKEADIAYQQTQIPTLNSILEQMNKELSGNTLYAQLKEDLQTMTADFEHRTMHLDDILPNLKSANPPEQPQRVSLIQQIKAPPKQRRNAISEPLNLQKNKKS